MVSTAAVGENDTLMRSRICRHLAWPGLELEETANAIAGPVLSSADRRIKAWVIPTDEQRMIAFHTQAIIAGGRYDSSIALA
jgi:acetate kinase